ncbi:MAG: hypothetical protein HY598_01910 [Candidatus Omnitrophica bacterium]|nr:hypothetical protein [Candidatus Omnitrophota bacterium]
MAAETGVSSEPQGGLRLFVGADRARKLQRIQALERSLRIAPLDRHQVDAASLAATELLALCRQQPAASPVRLIVVDQAHKLEAAGVSALLTLAEVIRRNACVVLLVEAPLPARHPLAQAGGAVTVEEFPGRDVAAVKPFALTDALGRRDAAAALTAMRDQLLAGKDPLDVLGLIVWQVQRWVAVKRFTIARESVDAILAATGLRPWQLQRIQAEVAERPMAALQQLLARCWQVDASARSGRLPPEIAVEQLVIEACRPQERAACGALL